jgi:iron(III) transport system permease protein
VFVDVMKELPATLVLRPFNFDTLATRTFALASDERLAEAALPSLAIIAVGVLPLLILARAVRRGTAAGRLLPPQETARIAPLRRE